MKKYLALALASACFTPFSQNIKIPVDTTIVTSHNVTIKNQVVSYNATT